MALKISLISVCLALALSIFPGCKKKETNGLPDMHVTLASNDSKPMGAKVFRTITGMVFEGFDIKSNARPFDTWYREFIGDDYFDHGVAYILLSPYGSIRKNEALDMKKFISKGNTMLIITDGLSDEFEEVFEVGLDKHRDTLSTGYFGMVDTYKYLADSDGATLKKFDYYFYPLTSKLDTIRKYTHASATLNMFGKADGVEMVIGSGKLILITNAQALSNYFLLTGNNYQFAMGILDYINFAPDYIYWDEFYRRNLYRPAEGSSIFDAILSKPPLKWAFWLIIALCCIAIVTNMVRRQRVVPVSTPNRNTSVEFTQTISRLYYNKRDNSNIAQKMIQHFLEQIRTTYYLPHQKLDNEFAIVLAGKTNQPLPKTERLVQRMASIISGSEVSDDLLLELNRQLTGLMNPTVTT